MYVHTLPLHYSLFNPSSINQTTNHKSVMSTTTPQQPKLYASHLSIPYTNSSSPLLTLDIHTPTTPPSSPRSPSFTLMYVAHSPYHTTTPHHTKSLLSLPFLSFPPLPFLFAFTLMLIFKPHFSRHSRGGGGLKRKKIATSMAALSATPSSHLSPSSHLYPQFSLCLGPGPPR